MGCEINPRPEPAEREAMLAALADDEDEQRRLSPWVQAVLPDRAGDDEP